MKPEPSRPRGKQEVSTAGPLVAGAARAERSSRRERIEEATGRLHSLTGSDWQAGVEAIFKTAEIPLHPSKLESFRCIASEYQAARKLEPLPRQSKRLRLALGAVHKARLALTKGLSLADRWQLRSADFESSLNSLSRLEALLEGCLELRAKGGRKSEILLDTLLCELIDLYEDCAGIRFQSSDKRQRYRGTNFVTGLAELVDPNLKRRDIKNRLTAAAALQSDSREKPEHF